VMAWRDNPDAATTAKVHFVESEDAMCTIQMTNVVRAAMMSFVVACMVTVPAAAQVCVGSWGENAAIGVPGVNDDLLGLTVYSSRLIAGGFFSGAGGQSANLVAQWNGSGWTNLPGGPGTPGGSIYASSFAIDGSDLIVGGQFFVTQGAVANAIARWN